MYNMCLQHEDCITSGAQNNTVELAYFTGVANVFAV